MTQPTRPQLTAAGLVFPHLEHGIANLAARLHGSHSPCPPLQHPSLARLEQAQTIILLVIDGMGCQQLAELSPGGWLRQQQTLALTSVFPSTTTSAITTYLTGLPPSVHTLTGWHLAAPEVDAVVTPLPLTVRHRGRHTPDDPAELARAVYRTPSALTGPRRQIVLQPNYILDSAYSLHHGGSAARQGWSSYEDLFRQLDTLLREASTPQFIYAYIPDLDSIMHHKGTTHPRCRQLLQRIEAHCAAFATTLSGRDAVLCISADHGQMDIPPPRLLQLRDFPELAACLRQPLSGEPRVAFCHVKPERLADFPQLAARLLGHAAWCLPAAQLLDEAWFGPGADANDPRLAARVGDYVLLLKEDWGLLDSPADAPLPKLLGNHGGLSAAEMMVPLIVIDGKKGVASDE